MKQALLLIAGLATAATCLTPAYVAAQNPDSVQLPAGATIRVTLQKPLDSKKNKAGDPVIAKSADSIKAEGHELLPRGTKILGHVTAASAHTKDKPEATLGLVFDHAILKNGGEVPLRLIVQAVAPGRGTDDPNMSMTPATAAGSAGGMGPVTGPVTAGNGDPGAVTPPGRVASPESPEASVADNLSERGELTPSCRGVLRIDGLALAPEDPELGSVIVSRKRNVQLDIGTQMMLRVAE